MAAAAAAAAATAAAFADDAEEDVEEEEFVRADVDKCSLSWADCSDVVGTIIVLQPWCL